MHRTTVEAVDRAVSAQPSGVPDELTAALRRRATLDDGIAERREAATDRLRAAVLPQWQQPPKTAEELLDLVVENADALASGDGTGVLRAAAACLVDTDLPEASTPSPDRETFEDTVAQQQSTAPSVTEEQLLACVRRHADGVERVRGLRQLTGGFSKETIVAVVERDRGEDEIVVRKIAPGRTADTLPGEFAALSFAWRGGIPVPEPLWLDESALGTPAFATRRSDGRCLGDVWGPVEPVEPEAAHAAARTIAALHSLDTGTLLATPLPPMTTRSEIAAAVAERQRVVDTVATGAAEPYVALVEILLAWLRAHVPADVPRPALVHGDFGLHNLLLDGGELTAVLDWERAHLGHPAEDLTYLRPSIDPVVDWDDFVDTYRTAGGDPPDQDRTAFYTVWHDVWRGISALRLRTRFLADPARVTDAMVGLLMTPRFLTRAAGNAFGVTTEA